MSSANLILLSQFTQIFDASQQKQTKKLKNDTEIIEL